MKSDSFKKAILKQLEKYKRRESPSVPKSTKWESLPKQQSLEEKYFEAPEPAKKIGRERLRTTEGVKMPSINLDGIVGNLKKTGVRCKFPTCEKLTERVDGYCFRHSNPISRNPKYRVRVPKGDVYDEATMRHKQSRHLHDGSAKN